MATTTNPLDAHKDQLARDIAQLEESIEPQRQAIAETERQINFMKAALAALDGHYLQPASRARASTPKGGPRHVTSPEDRQTAILDFVSKNQGTNTTEIADALGWSSQTAEKQIKALLAEGRMYSEGQRRGRKLFTGKAS